MPFHLWQASQQEEEILEANLHHTQPIINPRLELVRAHIHPRQRLRPDQAPCAQRPAELEQVVRRRNNPPACPIAAQALIPAHFLLAKINRLDRLPGVGRFRVKHQVRVAHVQRQEDLIGQVLIKAFPADLLNQPPQQDVPRVGIVVHFSRHAHGLLVLPGELDQRLRSPMRVRILQHIFDQCPPILGLALKVIGNPRGVPQQVFDGYLRRIINTLEDKQPLQLCRGEELYQWVLNSERSPLSQSLHQHRREHLANAGQMKRPPSRSRREGIAQAQAFRNHSDLGRLGAAFGLQFLKSSVKMAFNLLSIYCASPY